MFICVACLLSVAVVCAVRFAMCKLIVPAIVFAVLMSESSFVARPAKQLLWAYPLCVEVIVPDVRHRWYAPWMKGQRLIQVWLSSGFCSQILNVVLVQAASCDEVQGILEELLGCVRVLC